MYPKYFGLKEPSFSIAPDPQYLFLSEQHKEALAHLLYGAGESGGFVLLTGEVGTGKTTICRAFLEQLPEGVEVALILNPAVTANELLLSICDELGVQIPEGERSIKTLVDRLNAYLLEAHSQGRKPLLIIDEAQNLRPKVLEQVRLLTNLETSKHKLLQIFLIGQPELRQMLETEGLRQINQRITARFHLHPFTLTETGDYIRHRVAVAGVERPLFSAAAIRRIHKASGGLPRLINILCDRALLGACVTRSTQVTPAIVKRAAREVYGESPETRPRPPIRPAYLAVAAFFLAMLGGWLAYSWMPHEMLQRWAGLLQGERIMAVGAGAVTALTRIISPADQSAAAPEARSPGSLLAPVQTDAAVARASGDQGEMPAEPSSDAAVAAEPAAQDATGGTSVATAMVSDGVTPATPTTPVEPLVATAQTSVEAGSQDTTETPDISRGELPLIDQAEFESDARAATIARLSMPEADALRLLLRRWAVELDELPGSNPCARISAFGLACATEQGTLANVRYFDRPALLEVTGAAGERRFMVLGALDATHGTLDLPDGGRLAPVSAIESIWTGNYVLVWQLPPSRVPLIGPLDSGPAVRWLSGRLAEIPTTGFQDADAAYYDGRLTRAVRAFQASRGLLADGVAGPRTLIQVQNAVDLPGTPRLMPADDPAETSLAESPRP